ncbi:MAG: hypothetical protein AB7S26_23295 [Sandaracinaceae bacterium]
MSTESSHRAFRGTSRFASCVLYAAPALACALVLGCGATTAGRFPLRDPMWVDADQRAFAREPSELFNPPQWDRIDHIIFRQISEVWLYELDREAINVNAWDEVPDSSWFVNRIGRAPMSPARIRQGACRDAEEPPHPWTVIRAKPAGTSPGLVVRAADGRMFLFKIDFDLPERGTAADAIATRIVWAAGYYTPCNHVVNFTPDELTLATEPVDGHDPPAQEDVQRLIDAAGPAPGGMLRGSVSEFLEGSLLGGWRFEGLRDDDPNDVIPHEHRRDVRGMALLSAWLNHIDARAENNQDVWIQTGGGRGYIRHYVLDVGDSFGQVFPDSHLWSQSFGSSHYIDFQHIMEDFLSLGIAERPYFGAERGPAGHVLGYYDVARFEADQWRNGYPNPAFEEATERDNAWMARIIARMTEDHLRAAVSAGRFSEPLVSDELLRILMGRRERILERYLTRLSPLTDPETMDRQLCFTDLALATGIRLERRYYVRAFEGWPGVRRPTAGARAYGERACLTVPEADHPIEEPLYRAIDIVAESPGRERTRPLRVHLYELPSGELRVVGLERPSDWSPPSF